ncbi:hypothetical protein AAF712_014556 [Marasmius tenuissimus]|uniref:Ricin B lectin domain-containing protein n=1 Tax=Marasmius tenuissimus TaxID=585030 RepID=A0ABR2ZBS5_9AGAR
MVLTRHGAVTRFPIRRAFPRTFTVDGLAVRRVSFHFKLYDRAESLSIVATDTSVCLAAESNADGAAVALAVCDHVTDTFPNGNQTFVYAQKPLSGPIKTYGGSKCLDVPNGDATNGNKLQIWSCVQGSANQQWKVNSPNTIEWVGKNKCVDITDGNKTPGNSLQIWDCDTNSDNQSWFPDQE